MKLWTNPAHDCFSSGRIGLLALLVFLTPFCAAAQMPGRLTAAEALPSAPTAQNGTTQTTPGQSLPGAQGTYPPPAASGTIPSLPQALPGTTPPANTGPVLTLQQAQALAIKNNPQIAVGRLIALATHEVTREVRSNFWPAGSANFTGVDAEPGSRVTAGALNNPVIFDRAAAGATVSQLIYDFGRTSNLSASANYNEKAQNENAMATREQILLAVDQAFYNALQTQSILTVAEQTVSERQLVANQINELFKNKLKSELDLSFANVNLAQAQLLLLDAKNNNNAARATLSMVLGFTSLQNYQLAEETTPATAPPANIDDLIATSFNMRPEILAAQFQVESANKYRIAQRDQLFPTIRALGVIGVTPFGVAPPQINSWYGAVGGNMQIPIFNGFLYPAEAREARFRAEATNERLRDLRDTIARDVRTSWLNANTAYQRLSVTQQLLQQANLGLNLAQTRYHMGLGSIVELSQAQLQQTQAQISYVQAGYDYAFALATLTYETKGL